ncbi:MAG: sigma-70 family RNA polymerase sigma factor [Planctomycetota bacterium]
MPQDIETTQRFTLLWIKAQPKALAFIASLVRDRHHAEDLLQEVAITAVAKFDTFDRDRSFDAWVLGIARLKIMRYFRTTGRDRITLSEQTVTHLQSEYEQLAETRETRIQSLGDCIEKLPERARSILKRRYFGDMAVKDIAADEGRPANAIGKQLFMIRRKLEDCITRRMKQTGGDGS